MLPIIEGISKRSSKRRRSPAKAPSKGARSCALPTTSNSSAPPPAQLCVLWLHLKRPLQPSATAEKQGMLQPGWLASRALNASQQHA